MLRKATGGRDFPTSSIASLPTFRSHTHSLHHPCHRCIGTLNEAPKSTPSRQPPLRSREEQRSVLKRIGEDLGVKEVHHPHPSRTARIFCQFLPAVRYPIGTRFASKKFLSVAVGICCADFTLRSRRLCANSIPNIHGIPIASNRNVFQMGTGLT